MLILIDTDNSRVIKSFQDSLRVPAKSERGIDYDRIAGEFEKAKDFVKEYRSMFWRIFGHLQRAVLLNARRTSRTGLILNTF
jgi:hypothetical protein